MKRALAIMLVLLQIPLFLYPDNRLEAATEITPLQYYEEQSYRYFVGMMYYEMWKKTDGSWTDGGRKPNAGMRGDADFTYKFQFPGRKIKTVEARIYNPENDKVEYFEKSRSDKYLDYKRSISFETKNSDIKPFQKQGIGTDTTVIPITINMLLNAEDPKDIKKESCPSCAPEVEAYRIFVPILFKIELATQLNVKYFTTDGKSLNSIFTPVVNEEMTVGKEYVFTPPTHKDYEYVGFKKSTTDKDPSGVILRRDPDKLTYNGTHEKYTLHMYYQTKNGAV
ncbi:Ig domain protein group 2 domain protein [Paenibacillus alvei]|uniref:Ig domain protein group 2 domain protein n=1 Tax=Paenibacillus alvei TaxID=44250 RepID=UPI0030828642